MIELYKRNIWNDAKTVNVITTACFSKVTKVRCGAVFSSGRISGIQASFFLQNLGLNMGKFLKLGIFILKLGQIKIPLFKVTRPYINLLVKPRSFSGLLKKCNFMHFERQMPLKMHIFFFPEKKIKKKYVCLPYLKCSGLLPETHLFFFNWLYHRSNTY